MSRLMKIATVAIVAATVVGSISSADASRRYSPAGRYHQYGHRGIGPGGVIAGAALGVLGAAAAGVAADQYYNGYPAYGYGAGYGPRYGYDYIPGRGYYGPY